MKAQFESTAQIDRPRYDGQRRGQIFVTKQPKSKAVRNRNASNCEIDFTIEDEGKSGSGYSDDHYQHSQFHYGTFQGVANYPHSVRPNYNPPPPVVGLPQPVPPPGLSPYSYGYQSAPVQGYVAVAEGRPLMGRLPCCGLGFGWFMFIVGFFLGGFPWYIATFFLLFVRIDPREKPVACLIASALGSIAVLFGLTSRHHHHHHW